MKKTNIFLLHYAGGSRYSYHFLTPYLSHFTVHSLELPGRGSRVKERLFDCLPDGITDIHRQIRPFINPGRDIIFGHSLGAILAFFVTSELEKENLHPKYLVASGNAGPGIEETDPIHHLPSGQLKQKLDELGGIPREVLDSDELFDFYEPILRADLKLAESPEKKILSKISTPIFGIMGTEEPAANQIESWGDLTNGKFTYCLLEGNHFFIHDHPKQLSDLITKLAKG